MGLFDILQVTGSNLGLESDNFRGFPLSFQVNATIVPQIGHDCFMLHSTSFTIHYSLIILTFDAIQPDEFTAQLFKPQI
jgi:hypothetical protein